METQCAVPLPATARRELGASHRWKVLGVGVAANVSFSAAAAGIPTTAVWLRADYHLGNAALGLALGAMGLGVAITELPWGVATDRWGDRPILLTGLAATAAALLSMMLFVVPSHAGVPGLLWLVAAMCAFSGVLAWLWLHEPPEAPVAAHAGSNAGSPVAAAPVVAPLRDRMIWRVVAGIGILCVPQFAVLTFATVFLHDFAHVGIT